jgi:beta-mannosidase
MAIVLQPLENVTLDDLPPNLTNPSCQGTDGLLAPQGYSPYSNQPEFLRTNSSFPLPFDQNVTKNKISKWCPWDLQQSPPQKPGDGVYPYPDDNIDRPQFNPCYSACAKNNKPEDCCTGEYNSASKCSPGEYSKNIKSVCPDAYSFGMYQDFARRIRTNVIFSSIRRSNIHLHHPLWRRIRSRILPRSTLVKHLGH